MLVVLGCSAMPSSSVRAEATPTAGPCIQGTLNSGALSLTCLPANGWNGDLVVFAHGYVAADRPLGFYHLTLSDGTPLPVLVLALGYAFATTSYRSNGLAILEGVDDLRLLVSSFPGLAGRPAGRTYVVGVSEGSLIATLLAERHPTLMTGTLAACGPLAGLRDQVTYVGDFRVLFDVFFPNVLPGGAIHVPTEVMEGWDSTYAPAIVRALVSHPDAAVELISASGAAFDPAEPFPTIVRTTLEVLWYSVFGTNDAIAKLGGNPYGNETRVYRGSRDDVQLNARAQRVTADSTAVAALSRYETTARAPTPLVIIHTIGDDVVPFTNVITYLIRAQATGQGRIVPIPIARYGHCAFTSAEALVAFLVLAAQAPPAARP